MTLLQVCIVLTFNFTLLTLGPMQALGRWCSASASNPDTLAGREKEEVVLPCLPAKGSQGLQEAFGPLWVPHLAKRSWQKGKLGKLQFWSESDPSFCFINLMPKLARTKLLYQCLAMKFGDSSETPTSTKKRKSLPTSGSWSLAFHIAVFNSHTEGPNCSFATKNSVLYILVLKRLRKKNP